VTENEPSCGQEIVGESSCGQGIIDCEGGYLRGSDSTIKCASDCNGKCCIGKDACDDFTGKVSMDGSCGDPMPVMVPQFH
jgi:hypothetical protein